MIISFTSFAAGCVLIEKLTQTVVGHQTGAADHPTLSEAHGLDQTAIKELVELRLGETRVMHRFVNAEPLVGRQIWLLKGRGVLRFGFHCLTARLDTVGEQKNAARCSPRARLLPTGNSRCYDGTVRRRFGGVTVKEAAFCGSRTSIRFFEVFFLIVPLLSRCVGLPTTLPFASRFIFLAVAVSG